jgi:prepilin-type N-terminal cleavage/methylation domain-containing protein
MGQRGMTLVELVVVVAITVVVATALVSLTQGGRAFGKQSAVQQFDAAVAYAQSLAATSGNGATMVFAQNTSADGTVLPGFRLTIYSGRPTSATAVSASSLAPITTIGDASEAVLGSPPFSIFLNSAGHASAAKGTVAPGSVITTEPGCPTGEQNVTLTFSDPQGDVARSIPCNAAIAGAPVTIGSVPK